MDYVLILDRSIAAAAALLRGAIIVALCAGVTSSAKAYEPGSELLRRAETALAARGDTLTHVREVTQPGWTWLALELHDERFPLAIDIVGSSEVPADKVMYMLPGGSTNFHASFFTPNAKNIALFLAKHGYLVVGISPREDSVRGTLLDYRFMGDWGLPKHSADVRAVVLPLQAALGLPYEVLGHSYGAMTALDYAARYHEEQTPARVLALDIYLLGQGDPQAKADARRTYDAHVQLLARGTYADSTYAWIKPAQLLAQNAGSLDSGVSRAQYGYSGTFTFESLYFAQLIDSSRSDGVHSSITGLPGDWLFGGGACAGSYVFADNPREDRYALSRTPYEVLLSTSAIAGSGLIAVALERDIWGLNAETGYVLDWSAIEQPVIWINSELGYGVHRDGAQRMREAGNTQVVDLSLPGYGHVDMLLGDTAERDVWEPLLAQ